MQAYINKISTAVPPHDIHSKFVDYAPSMLPEGAPRKLFARMANRAQIEHRYSFLEATTDIDQLDQTGFYRRSLFPGTRNRMQAYEQQAFPLVCQTVDDLFQGFDAGMITHVLVTSCTGFYAPGLDLQIVRHYGMRPSVERSIIGFMGCYAAINALKMARHIVRSDAEANVLIVNIELCTLHLQETTDMEQILAFLIFGDGCAASIISAKPLGIAMHSFHCAVMPDSAEQITWHVGEQGFDMLLSGQVPLTLARSLPDALPEILHDIPRESIRHWAVHPGGRTVLDAVEAAVGLRTDALSQSRDILRRYGNMSSATIMFVLKAMLEDNIAGQGCALAFGPGLTAETMRFSIGTA